VVHSTTFFSLLCCDSPKHCTTQTLVSLVIARVHEEVVATELLFSVFDRVSLVDTRSEVSRIASECDAQQLQEGVHACSCSFSMACDTYAYTVIKSQNIATGTKHKTAISSNVHRKVTRTKRRCL
jgi:microcompartment protein CcmL/EutN